jgi:hypothetical protein
MRVLRTGLAARVTAQEPGVQLLGKITDLYFDGDMEASVANTGQVSSRIDELLPVADIDSGVLSVRKVPLGHGVSGADTRARAEGVINGRRSPKSRVRTIPDWR